MKKYSPVRIAMFMICSLVLWSANAGASSVYVTYGNVGQSGGAAPSSPTTPWLTALFEDQADGDVLLTLSATNLTANEFVSDWFFNFTSQKSVENLVFSVLNDGNANFISPVVLGSNKKPVDYTDDSGYKGAGGYNGFKIDIPFVTSNKDGSRFTDDRYSQILISGVSNMIVLAEDFNIPLSGNDPELVSVAHVQALSDGRSSWLKGYDPPIQTDLVATPEPGTMILLGAGILGAIFMRRRTTKTS